MNFDMVRVGDFVYVGKNSKDILFGSRIKSKTNDEIVLEIGYRFTKSGKMIGREEYSICWDDTIKLEKIR